VIDVLGAKRLGLLREIVPTTTLITVLLNPSWATFDTQLKDVQEAARAVGQHIEVLRANTDARSTQLSRRRRRFTPAQCWSVRARFFTVRRDQIVALAARDALPTIYGQREFMAAGGLMSYGTSFNDAYRQAGVYSGQNLGRRATGRAAGGAISQVRATDQPQGRPVAPPHNSARVARHRRRGDRMRRRDFITLFGGAAAAWPLAARAQQAGGIRRVVVLMGAAETAWSRGWLASFLQRLDELGWREGYNVVTQVPMGGMISQSRCGPGLPNSLPVRTDVAVTYTNLALAVLKPIAGNVPIVFVGVGDPVGGGFVSSLARPGGNITGFASHEPSMGGKWLEVLKETAPTLPEPWRSCTLKPSRIRPCGNRSKKQRRDWQSRP